MALFSDGQITTIDDLRQYESSILDVANTEAIDLDAKLQLADREIGVRLTAFLLRERDCPDPAITLNRVIVIESLAQWHTLHSLSLIYRDAYNSQLNDRYLGKWTEYDRLARTAEGFCLEIGVGLVSDPISRAALPDCGSTIGGSLLATTYYIQVAWQNGHGSIGAPSDLLPVNCNTGAILSVTAVDPPANATGWFVYAGLTDTSVRCQNITPLALGATWFSPLNGLGAGVDSPAPQKPDFYVRRRRRLPRG